MEDQGHARMLDTNLRERCRKYNIEYILPKDGESAAEAKARRSSINKRIKSAAEKARRAAKHASMDDAARRTMLDKKAVAEKARRVATNASMDNETRRSILDEKAMAEKARIASMDDTIRRTMLNGRAAAKRYKISKMCESDKRELLERKAQQEKRRRADTKQHTSKPNIQSTAGETTMAKCTKVDMTQMLLTISGVAGILRHQCSYDTGMPNSTYTVRLYDSDHEEKELWTGNDFTISRQHEAEMHAKIDCIIKQAEKEYTTDDVYSNNESNGIASPVENLDAFLQQNYFKMTRAQLYVIEKKIAMLQEDPLCCDEHICYEVIEPARMWFVSGIRPHPVQQMCMCQKCRRYPSTERMCEIAHYVSENILSKINISGHDLRLLANKATGTEAGLMTRRTVNMYHTRPFCVSGGTMYIDPDPDQHVVMHKIDVEDIHHIQRGIIIPDTVPPKVEFTITSEGGNVVYASVKTARARYTGLKNDKTDDPYFEFYVSFRNIAVCTKLNMLNAELRINGERLALLNDMIEGNEKEYTKRNGDQFVTTIRHFVTNERHQETSAWREDEVFLLDTTFGPLSKCNMDGISNDTRVRFDMITFIEYNLKKGTNLHEVACKSILKE